MSETIETMSPIKVEPTTFLGVTIDTINGPLDPRIKKALERSASLLDILKFIKVTKFKLNMAKRWGKAPSSNMVLRTMFV